ncbi:hypothetical protein CDAR_197661 [Caerostris darwini]|uniref:Uncharacterized protein n=1 Tax=Caerostris darwini TaxID=1538125 RepID=A0AAV4VXM8_9ARAC|nr:hypothetical protein CDAR_197661 [Caerostris darwini]
MATIHEPESQVPKTCDSSAADCGTLPPTQCHLLVVPQKEGRRGAAVGVPLQPEEQPIAREKALCLKLPYMCLSYGHNSVSPPLETTNCCETFLLNQYDQFQFSSSESSECQLWSTGTYWYRVEQSTGDYRGPS